MTGSVRSSDPPLLSPPTVDPREREAKGRGDPDAGGGSVREESGKTTGCVREVKRSPDPPLPSPPTADPRERGTSAVIPEQQRRLGD